MTDLTIPKNLNPDVKEFETMQRAAKMAVISGFLPGAYNQGNQNERIAKAVVVAMKGRELGVPMMQAFSQINVIAGKPAISAELMLALIYRAHPKAEISFPEYNDKKCAIKARRPGAPDFTTFEFTMDDAEKAELTTRWDKNLKKKVPQESWKKYPRAMLRSRCISEMARSLFPDAIMGCSYTPEELGQDVNENGEIVHNVQKEEPRIVEASEPTVEYTVDDIPFDDDINQDNQPEKGDSDLGHYVIGVGKNKGTRLMDEGHEFWGQWVDKIEDWAKKNGKDIDGKLKQDMDFVKKYLGHGEEDCPEKQKEAGEKSYGA